MGWVLALSLLMVAGLAVVAHQRVNQVRTASDYLGSWGGHFGPEGEPGLLIFNSDQTVERPGGARGTWRLQGDRIIMAPDSDPTITGQLWLSEDGTHLLTVEDARTVSFSRLTQDEITTMKREIRDFQDSHRVSISDVTKARGEMLARRMRSRGSPGP